MRRRMTEACTLFRPPAASAMGGRAHHFLEASTSTVPICTLSDAAEDSSETVSHSAGAPDGP